MKVFWTPEAEQDRAAIWDYLVVRDPSAALRIDELFGEAVAKLADFPKLGHVGTVAGTRELTPHRSYRIIYEIVDDTVWILVVIHTARQWPPLLDRIAKNAKMVRLSQRLATLQADQEYAAEYARFVEGMAFAGAGEVPSFPGAIDALTKLCALLPA